MRVGLISFLNLSRIWWPIQEKLIPLPSSIECVIAPPQELWRRLKVGKLDVAFISLLDYLTHSEEVELCEPLVGIAAQGQVQSVLCFYPEEWDNHPPQEAILRLDPQSATSNRLAQILIYEGAIFKGIKNWRFEIGSSVVLENHAYILIGDKALIEKPPSGYKRIDVGQAWRAYAKLPFCYAVLCKRKDAVIDKESLLTALQAAQTYSGDKATQLIHYHRHRNPSLADLSDSFLQEYLFLFDYFLQKQEMTAIEHFVYFNKIWS